MLQSFSSLLSALVLVGSASALLTDPFQVYAPTTVGEPLTLEHLFYDQWPTGLSVTSNGTIYANFPTVLNYTNDKFTLGIVTSNTTEAAFPSAEYNEPASFLNPSNPAYGAADPDHFISVQSVVVDELDRVWALDTGRPTVNNSTLVYASYGGPKLVGFYQNGTRFANYVLPQTTAYPDTYLNDVRFDLRPSTLPSGQGVAYITDSSNEGRNAIIVIDLGTGNSWRHLDSTPETRADPNFLSSYDNKPLVPVTNGIANHITTGSDGLSLSSDGAYVYWSPLASRRLYRVPTSALLVEPGPENPTAAEDAVAAIEFHGQVGGSHADGMEMDASGLLYIGQPEQNSITVHNPANGSFATLTMDPRIQWPDTLSVGTNNRLYFTSNQYWLQPSYNNGTDYRRYPAGIFSVPIPAGKVQLT